MRQRFLERQPLLKHVALHDARKESRRQLPARLCAITSEPDQRRLARLMVLENFRDSPAMIVKGIAVRGQDRLDLEPANAL